MSHTLAHSATALTADECWRRQVEFPHTERVDGEIVEASPTTPRPGPLTTERLPGLSLDLARVFG